MMNSKQTLFSLLMCVLAIAGCDTQKQAIVGNELALTRAKQTLDSLYLNYSVSGTCLLRENYPSNIGEYTATYLASEEQKNMPNLYSYLWPYSGTFSAVNALFATTGDKEYKSVLDNKVLVGLEEYFDTRRTPEAYASYINSAPQSDRFYDDNVWLGIDFTDTYMLTKEPKYLQKAQLIWNFIESGTDDNLGGGIYWCEQRKESKNTCSNAPGSVFALKLFEATKDSAYFVKGQRLYEWTQTNLQDSTDYLYFDNIDHDEHCCCGHHHHHHDHDADEVFTSWGVETAKKFSKADIEHALTELDTGNYGMILRSKGIVDGGADGWLEFDYVPGEWEVRARGADVGGKLVVIGSKLDEKAIAALFGC